jgi:hypothetical protein
MKVSANANSLVFSTNEWISHGGILKCHDRTWNCIPTRILPCGLQGISGERK